MKIWLGEYYPIEDETMHCHFKKYEEVSFLNWIKILVWGNTHVYCTNCKYFKAVLKCMNDNSNLKIYCDMNCPCCECDCYNPEDSRPFKERLSYKKRRQHYGGCR